MKPAARTCAGYLRLLGFTLGASLLDEELRRIVPRHGPADQVALQLLTTQSRQRSELFVGLDAFTHHLEAQGVGHVDDGFDDGAASLALFEHSLARSSENPVHDI